MLASTPSPTLAPTAAAGLRRRVTRFCLAVLGVAYLRRTWASLFQQRAMLQLQQTASAAVASAAKAGMAVASSAPPRRGDRLLWRALTYTLTSQIIAASEFLLPLVKPLLAARIGRLLVWKGPRVQPNAVYGPHARNTVDVYGVESAAERKAGGGRNSDALRNPVLVFVHGGAWSFGHKWQYGLVGEYLASALGILVAVVNYRTYPTGHVQDMVEDVERAIDWVRRNCDAFGGDKEQIFLGGHSSGAHVGALTLMQSAMRVASPGSKQNKSKSQRGEVVNIVKGFIGLAGPFDIADHYVFESERAIGPFRGVHEISPMKPAILGIDNFKAHSPTALAAECKLSKLPKFHILHGVDDTVVPSSSSEKLAQALTRAGQDATFRAIHNCTHEDILFAVMGDNVACRAQVVEHIERIMQSVAPADPAARATAESRALARPMAKL